GTGVCDAFHLHRIYEQLRHRGIRIRKTRGTLVQTTAAVFHDAGRRLEEPEHPRGAGRHVQQVHPLRASAGSGKRHGEQDRGLLRRVGLRPVDDGAVHCQRMELSLQETLVTAVYSLIYFGGAVTKSVTGYLGDSYGRKPVFVLVLWLSIASSTATIF
ncbi:unnamed protein product, partial [Ixodes persulcatus]